MLQVDYIHTCYADVEAIPKSIVYFGYIVQLL